MPRLIELHCRDSYGQQHTVAEHEKNVICAARWVRRAVRRMEEDRPMGMLIALRELADTVDALDLAEARQL